MREEAFRLRSSHDVLGLPIYATSSGKQIGRVRDMLFDHHQQLFGLLVEGKGWVKRRSYIPADRIATIGLDAVTVDNESVIQPLTEEHEDMIGVCSGKRKLKGLPVLTATGSELGRLENVYFLEKVGTLIGYELTDGLLTDLKEGRKALRTAERLTWGDDALIVPGKVTPELTPVSDRK